MQPPVRAVRPYLWPLLAAAALWLCLIHPATGRAATARRPLSAAASAAGLDPSAGWHGRAIRRVVRSVAPSRRSTRTAWFDLAPGVGYATAQGSPAARMLQRRLRRLGYAVGPVDGRYGPRTRAAVGWFQLKHGLRADGVAGPATQRRLQARLSGGAHGATQRAAAPHRATGQGRPRRAATGRATTVQPSPPTSRAPASAGRRPGGAPDRPRRTRRSGAGDTARSSDRWLVAGLAVAAVLAIVAALAGAARQRRRRGRRAPEGTVVSLSHPLWIAGRSADPAIGRFAGTATAVHVSPPANGADAPPVTRYRVVDDIRRTSVWVAAADIRERRVAARHDVTRRRARAGSDVAARIGRLHRRGLSAEAIAGLLNAEAVPPPAGEAAWRPGLVAEHLSGSRPKQAIA